MKDKKTRDGSTGDKSTGDKSTGEEIIRYGNTGMCFGGKNVISGFSLLVLRGKKILLRGK